MKKIHKLRKWEDEKDRKMEQILRAKADQVKEVRDELLNTGDRPIAEAVQEDMYWSCGLSKEAAMNTDPSNWPVENKLGQIWMKLRATYREERKKRLEFKQVVSKKDRIKRKHSDEKSGTPTAKPRKMVPPHLRRVR